MRNDNPVFLPIAEVRQENSQVKTFFFDHPLGSLPGQFVMVWIPGVDQKPFSVSYDHEGRFGVSVFPVGPMSKAFCAMERGDRVGITGPYGRPFTVTSGVRYILVGGGYGAGPLATLAEHAAAQGGEVDICLGAKTKELLLFTERIGRMPDIILHTATDDGSAGHHGYVTDILARLLETRPRERVCVATCGPELMEKAVLDLCNRFDVPCEISIERYMKCGFGVCGQCCMDGSGQPACQDGPVVARDAANRLTEFGKYHRDKSGTKIFY